MPENHLENIYSFQDINQDSKFYSDFIRLIMTQLYNNNSENIEELKDNFKLSFPNDKYFGIIKDSQELVGSLSLSKIKSLEVINISNFIIDQKYQSNGIGSYCLKNVEKYAKENGLKSIILYPIDSANDFYLKNGYKFDQSSGRMFKNIN